MVFVHMCYGGTSRQDKTMNLLPKLVIECELFAIWFDILTGQSAYWHDKVSSKLLLPPTAVTLSKKTNGHWKHQTSALLTIMSR